MKVGASQYHPGLTVRWRRHGRGFLAIYANNRVGVVIAGNAAGGYAVLGRFPGRSTVDEPFSRRCDAKRAAEVLVGQWWREKCERESKAADYKARVLAAFRGENHGTGTVDVVARAIAERVNAAQKSFDETIARSDFMRCPEGPDLDRLAALYGVERRESAEETRAAMADALRNAAVDE